MNRPIWLTGHSRVGKSTIANALKQEIDCVNLDGDSMRASISLNAGFSREDRLEHNLRVARLAKVLSDQKTVIVSVIAPMLEARRLIDEICSPIWIRIERNLPVREGHFYEISPEYPVIDTDVLSVPECVKKVREIAGIEPGPPACIFPGRWQPLHSSHIKLFKTTLNEGQRTVAALRDTTYSDSNPYTIGERKKMIREALGNDVEIVVIPDVKDFCHGRGVGWGVREIELSQEDQSVSATKIREQGNK